MPARYSKHVLPVPVLASLLLSALLTRACEAVSCTVTKPHEVSEAEHQFLKGHFDQAATLYQATLQKTPGDPVATAGLTRVLLRQQKIDEADSLVSVAAARTKDSAILLTALAEVQYRQGTPWLAVESVRAASKIDLCLAQTHLLNARLNRLNSNYESAAKELAMAHSLDPYDPNIRLRWLNTLPLVQRVEELETYLAGDTGDDPDEVRHLHMYLESMRKRLAEPHKACRLVSDTSTTEIPFVAIMRDAQHVRAFGLDVKLNDHNSRLQIDTGAGGLVVTRSVADHAHLVRYTEASSSGVGSQGERESYRAYAETIRIGDLEFHVCEVSVVDKLGSLGIDGLLGMDVFSRFLVTLDFPMRKLALGQLPKRPDEVVAATPTLATSPPGTDADDTTERAGTRSSGGAPSATVPALSRSLHDRYIAPEMKDWTRVYRDGHDLLITTRLNNSPPKLLLLDTGAFATSVSPKVAREVTKVGDSDRKVRGVNGEVDKVYSADEIEFQFGNIRQKAHDVVVFDTPSLSKNLGLEVVGFIGATTLGQVTMSIDYRDALVKFDYDAKRGYKYPGLR